MTMTTTENRVSVTLDPAAFAAALQLAHVIDVPVEVLLDYSIATHAREDLSRGEFLSAGLKYCRGRRCRCRR